MSIPLPGRILPLAPGTFRALGHRDFRRLWLGQVVSLGGRWMQSVAQGWLVLRLSDSAFQLGLVGFCNFLPILLFALVAGAAADRFPRRKALLWTQGSAMVLAFALAALTWLDLVRVWHVALLAFGVGVSAAFDIPFRQSLLQDLVGRDDLPNAIALNSMAFNGTRLLGPAVGGLVLGLTGEAAVFFLNGLSYVPLLLALGTMRADGAPTHAHARRQSWLGEILEGLAWVRRSLRARVFLTLVAIASVFGLPYSILLPVFARDVLGIGATGLGLLMGVAGLGALAGGLAIAAGALPAARGTRVAGALGTTGACLIGFAWSHSVWWSAVLLFLVGGAMLVQLATSNTLLQLLAPEALRGRVVSIYMLGFMGMAPLGSLQAGLVARHAGAPAAVALGGAICLVAAVWFGFRLPTLRRRGGPAADTGERPGAQLRRSRISTS